MTTQVLTHDASKYHPHDLLILKHFPEQDLPTLWDVDDTHSLILPRAALWYRTPLEHHLFLLKTLPAHCVFFIPELRELILRHAPPRAQYAAWHVNTTWRSTVSYILESHYRSYHPCSPIAYGQLTSPDLVWLPPSDEEVASVEQDAPTLSSKTLPDLALVYYPARLSQAHSLSEPAYRAIQTAYERVRFESPAPLSSNQFRQWLDLSQLSFNPYFLDLWLTVCSSSLADVTLLYTRGPPQHRVFRKPLRDAAFEKLIRSMYLTEPPCQALSIHIPRACHPTRNLATKVCDANGIRVGHFLSELEHHADHSLSA
jgi:hypothetical protein